MKIYFTAPLDDQFENVFAQEVVPKKCGSVIEHLAFALWATQKFANRCRTRDYLKRHEQIKNCFFKQMSKHALTRNLLVENNLLKNFSFTSNYSTTDLAKCFCLPLPENSAGLELVERRAFEIPDCPVYLSPIKYGIRLQNDPYWYDVKAAEENIFIANANRDPVSPMTRSRWVAVEEVRKFSVGMDDLRELETDLLSAQSHKKIVEHLKLLMNARANQTIEIVEIIDRFPLISQVAAMMGSLYDITHFYSRWRGLLNIAAWVGAASLTYLELSTLEAATAPTLQSLGFSERVSHISGFPYLPFAFFIFAIQLTASINVLNRLGLINHLPEYHYPARQGEIFRVTVANVRDLVNVYEQARQARQRPAQNNSSVAALMQRFGLHRVAAAPREVADAFSFDGMEIAARLGFR